MPTINDANSIYMPNRALEERELREERRIFELRSAIASIPETGTWHAAGTVRSSGDEELMLSNVNLNLRNLFKFLKAERDNYERVKNKSEEQEILMARLQRHLEILARSDRDMAERVKALAGGVLGPKTFFVPGFRWADPKPLLPIITESMRWSLGYCMVNLPIAKAVADSLFPDGDILDRSSAYIGELEASEKNEAAFRAIANASIFMKGDKDTELILTNMFTESAEARAIVNQFRIGLDFTANKIFNDIPLMSRLAARCSEACHRVRTQPQGAQEQKAAKP